MEWNDGFSARFYGTIVDALSWRDIKRFEITGGSVSKTASGLMESADLDLKTLPASGEVWIRIWMDARQNSNAAHEALFTGILSIPGTEWDGNRHSYNAECYSVLKPAEDVLMPIGWYAPAFSSGAELAARLLRVGAAPVEYDAGSPTLKDSIVAEGSENNLTMAWKIVNAIGWRIRIDGRGVIRICPKAKASTAKFDSLENDSVETEIEDKKNWFSCPNVFRATNKGVTAIARDDDESSPYSTVSRGREIWKEDKSCNLNVMESLEDYVYRRLREEQSPARMCSYSRRYYPDLFPGDVIRLHYPAQEIDGDFRISSQKIELGYNARTSEESEILMSVKVPKHEIWVLIDDVDYLIVTEDDECIMIIERKDDGG